MMPGRFGQAMRVMYVRDSMEVGISHADVSGVARFHEKKRGILGHGKVMISQMIVVVASANAKRCKM